MTRFSKKFYKASIACVFSLWFTTAQTALADNGNFSLSYSGRLTQADGAPLTGPVDITVRFWTAATAGNTLTAPIELASTTLNEGVFTLSLELNPAQVSAVFGQGTDPAFIEITAAGKTYPRQQYNYVPYSLRVPVDNKTVAFDADGKLGLALTSQPSANQFLTKDSSGRLTWGSPSVTTLQGQNIASTAPTSGQVLTYSGGQWGPQTFAVAGAAGGTVTNVTATSPITVATGTTTPEISIAQASGSVNGYLSSADWSTFNAKQNALGFVPVNKSGDTMTGPLTAPVIIQAGTSAPAASGTGEGRIYFDSVLNRFQVSQNGSAYAPLTNNATVSRVDVGAGLTGGPITTSGTISLSNTSVSAGSYTRANITVDAQGRLTAAQSAPAITDDDIATGAGIAQSKIQGLVSDLAAKEPALPSGGTAPQYLAGSKTWQTLSTTVVAEGTNEYFTPARAKSALSASAPITYNFTSGTIGISAASGSSNGYLSSADWTTFNGKQNALEFAPLNKAGDTMSGALNMDGSDLKSVGNIGMAASKTLLLSNNAADPTGLTAADKGKTWFNSQTNQVKYWDGSNAQALGVSGAGLTNLNGLTGSTQTFATGSSGNNPVFNSNGTVHTLNIPMASVSGVTAGLVSNSDYSAFSNKVGGVTAGTGISVVTTGGTATVSLSSVGTDGTYAKVTTNAQGQVISGSSLTASDIPGLDANKIASGVLGVSKGGTGVNSTATFPTSGVVVTRDAAEMLTNKTLSGATINGASNISGSTTIDTTGTVNSGAQTVTGNVTILGNSTTSNKLVLNDKGSTNSVSLKAPDTLASSLTLELPSSNGSSGQVLSTNGSGTLSWVSTAVGSVTSVTGAAPIAVANGTSAPVISMAQANGTTNGYLSSADWTNFNGKQAAGSYLTELTGDVTAAGPGSATTTLATVAIPGTATKVSYDVKGRVTSGTSLTAADVPPLSAAVITSGTLTVANGGTGAITLAANNVILGNGTGAVQSVAPGSIGNVLTSNGTTWQSTVLPSSVTSVTGAAPIAVANGTSAPVISMAQANGTTNGYLSSADWTTFNGKQAAGSYLTALTGDVTAAGPGSAAATLATVATPGTSTKVTYDLKGRVTSGTSLVAADLPSHSAALITSGTLAVANGGTGLSTTPSNGQLLIGNGANYALGNLTAGNGIDISNSAGAITVSATADASTKVSKTGDTMSGALSLPANGLVAGTNQLVLANGNVGIGTTAPGQKLSVAGVIESTTGGFRFPDGTSQTSASNGNAQIFTSNGTWTKPSWATGDQMVTFEMWGGGGGGGASAGGGGGAYVRGTLKASQLAATQAVTVGTGGPAGSSGTGGGNSSFFNFTAYGGGAGLNITTGGGGGGTAGAGSAGSGGSGYAGAPSGFFNGGSPTVNGVTCGTSGSVYGGGGGTAYGCGTSGGASVYGGGGGGTPGNSPGASIFGGSGGAYNTAGSIPGGGGGGGNGASGMQAGARGEVRIWVSP